MWNSFMFLMSLKAFKPYVHFLEIILVVYFESHVPSLFQTYMWLEIWLRENLTQSLTEIAITGWRQVEFAGISIVQQNFSINQLWTSNF